MQLYSSSGMGDYALSDSVSRKQPIICAGAGRVLRLRGRGHVQNVDGSRNHCSACSARRTTRRCILRFDGDLTRAVSSRLQRSVLSLQEPVYSIQSAARRTRCSKRVHPTSTTSFSDRDPRRLVGRDKDGLRYTYSNPINDH